MIRNYKNLIMLYTFVFENKRCIYTPLWEDNVFFVYIVFVIFGDAQDWNKKKTN